MPFRVISSRPGVDPSEITWVRSWSADFPDHHTVDFTADPIDTSFQTWYVDRPLEWRPVHTLPETPEECSFREPAAFLNRDGNLELFLSSNRARSWSIWHTTLTDIDPPAWEELREVTSAPYSQRDPYPIATSAGTLLLYRSDESVRYTSQVYRATETLDVRYAGSTTVDTRNVAGIALRERFDDFQSYVYDVGENGQRGDRNWYARDTVGIYLNPDTDDEQIISRNRNLIHSVLRQFLPSQVRVVFIIPIVSREQVYTYDFPDTEPQRLIGEQFFDSLDTSAADDYSGFTDEYQDGIADWVWIRSWSLDAPNHHSVDFTADPIDTNFRTVHIGLQALGQDNLSEEEVG